MSCHLLNMMSFEESFLEGKRQSSGQWLSCEVIKFSSSTLKFNLVVQDLCMPLEERMPNTLGTIRCFAMDYIEFAQT